MKESLARQYLMRALAMKRKNVKTIQQRVREGLCIMEGCGCKHVSRGLCDRHRQRWYLELRRLGSDEERAQAEEKAIREGLILASKEQEEILRAVNNPFHKAVS